MAAFNPPVPFKAPLDHLRSNDVIFVNGTSSHGSFSVNLKTEGGDIALHFNPRLSERQVVRNARIGGSWGAEERQGGFPFVEGQPFEVIIMVTDFHYKVAINGAHYTEFNHRIPKEAVRQLSVKGDVVLQSVRYPSSNFNQVTTQPLGQAAHPGFQVSHQGGMQSHHGGQPSNHGGRSSPHSSNSSRSNSPPLGQLVLPPSGQFLPHSSGHFMPPPFGQFLPPSSSHFTPPPFRPTPGFSVATEAFPQLPIRGQFQPVYNPPTPYAGPIVGALQPGSTVRVNGIPIGNRFTINLQCGPNEGENIALHFDVRFNCGSDHNVVVRNSFISGGWGGEERHESFFPFVQNAPFDVGILAEATHFKIFVNGQHFADFNHRLPLPSVDFLIVCGDVRITSIMVQ